MLVLAFYKLAAISFAHIASTFQKNHIIAFVAKVETRAQPRYQPSQEEFGKSRRHRCRESISNCEPKAQHKSWSRCRDIRSNSEPKVQRRSRSRTNREKQHQNCSRTKAYTQRRSRRRTKAAAQHKNGRRTNFPQNPNYYKRQTPYMANAPTPTQDRIYETWHRGPRALE
jgi:hypothetical protein